MQVWDKHQSHISLAGSLLMALVTFVIARLLVSVFLSAVVAAAIALVFYAFNMKRYLARRSLIRKTFPSAWRKILEERVSFYRCLSAEEKSRFEQNVQIFLAENRITAVSTQINDEIRLLVAGSAVMLIFGHAGWEYRRLPEILIYPGPFDEHYSVTAHRSERVLSGIVVPHNAIVISRDELLRAFEPDAADEVTQVALHEFAHALDLADGFAEGIPADLEASLVEEWDEIMRQELRKVRNRQSVLNPYAGKNRAELFAVAVEHFFQAPAQLAARHAVLYNALVKFFNQDPAGSRL